MEQPDVCHSRGRSLRRDQRAVLRRLSRPVAEMFAIARHPLANSRDLTMASNLVKLLPPVGIVSSIKNRQYLSRLSHTWHQKSRLGHIVLFDQGFIQAVCSLAMAAGVTDEAAINRALDNVPKSDLLVRLEAPLNLLEHRLQSRQGRQGRMERLLEHDLKRDLATVGVIDILHAQLMRRGHFVLRTSSLDQASLNQSVDTIERKVVETLKSEHRGLA